MALVGLVCFALGYRFYAKYIAERVYRTEAGEAFVTPAVQREDGRDFVPTSPHILFGHHFVSVAGAAPIVGPAIAVVWGWLPAFLWVVLGTIFMGAVHDFGALAISARNGARSVGDLCGIAISPRVRLAFLIILVILAWVVLAVFALIIALLFMKYHASVFAVNFEIVVALGIGWLYYKKGVKILIPSIVALVLLYGAVYVGTRIDPEYLSLPGLFGADGVIVDGWVNGAANPAAAAAAIPPLAFWIILLLVYSFIASVLPVWVLLQPRDFINSHQLFVGLGLVYIGIFLANPSPVPEAIRADVPLGPSLFPLLFVTIACGAISGFHGLVASGTTSKQLADLRHARPIGYGGMVGEGTLALAAVIATTCGIANAESWHLHYYRDWVAAGGGGGFAPIYAFVDGCAFFLGKVGLDTGLAAAVVAVLVISFAATTLDSATRIQRYIISELFESLRMPRLAGNAIVCAGLAAGAAILLAFLSDKGKGGMILWPIFGASNQMIAAVTLLLLAVYLVRRKRPVWPVAIPMVFVGIITLTAMVGKAVSLLAPPTHTVATAGFTVQGGRDSVFHGDAIVTGPVVPLSVATVADGGPAAAAGLPVGATITRITVQRATPHLADDAALPELTDQREALLWIESHLHQGDTITVTVATEPAPRDVVIPLGALAKPGTPNIPLGIVALVIAFLDVWILAEATLILIQIRRQRAANPDADLTAGLQ